MFSAGRQTLFCFILSVQLVLPQAMLAAGSNVNLSSTAANVTAAAAGVIKVNGANQRITVNEMITPAESLALSQVLAGGKQGLVIGKLGNATGGSLVLSAATVANGLTGLVVPKGVTVVDPLASLSITGALTNAGKIYALSSSATQTTDTISATSISNAYAGLISTVLPAGTFAALKPIAGLNLSLVADDSITNAGVISSAGSLALTAGGTITNALPAGTTGTAPVMRAATGLSLSANGGTITNAGLIATTAGNINLTSQTASSLTVSNALGTFKALAGTIDVRDASFSGNFDTDISGGTLDAQTLNIYSGSGNITVDVAKLVGTVNLTGGAAQVGASSGSTDIGTAELTGDPTFYNTSGDVVLTSDLSFPGQDIAVIAAGNIISNGCQVINSSSPNSGGEITLIAGAAFITNGPPQSGPSGDNTSSILVTGGLPGGGTIDLNTTPISAMSSVGGSNSGGNITLIAYGGSGSGAGRVLLPATVTVTSGSGGTDLNGTVTVIAGATSGSAIQVGNINTQGANNSTGNIYMLTGAPSLTGCGNCTGSLSIAGGSILEGGYSTEATSAPAGSTASITAGNLTSTGAPIQLLAGGSITTGNVSTAEVLFSASSGAIASGTVQGSGVGLIAGKTVTATGITSTGGGPVQINADTLGGSHALNIGGTGTGAIGFIDLIEGAGYTWPFGRNNLYISNGGTGGIDWTSAGAIVINTPGQTNTFGLNAGSGTLTLPSGTITVGNSGAPNTNVFMMSAQEIKANGTQINIIPDASGQCGTVALGATIVDVGAGLTINGDGTDGTGAFVSIGGANSVNTGGTISLGGFTYLDTFNPNSNPLTVQGSGALAMSQNGNNGTVGLYGGNIIINCSSVTLSANAAGSVGSANNTNALAIIDATGNLTVSNGALTLSSSGNSTGGFGGNVEIIAQSFTTGGGAVSLIGEGQAPGYTGALALLEVNSYTGKGTPISVDISGINGSGAGTLQVENGTGGNDLSINGLQVNGANNAPNAQSGLSALVEVSAAGNLTLTNAVMNVSALGANGGNPTVNIAAGTGTVSMSGSIVANGTGSGQGGSITISGNGVTTTGAESIAANGGATGTGGAISITASGAASNLAVSGSALSLSATGGSTSGNGGVISLSAGGNVSIDGAGISAQAPGSGNGGTINVSAGTGGSGTLSLSGNFNVNGGGTNGNGGTLNFIAPTITMSGANLQLQANGSGTGNGGNVILQSANAGDNLVLGGGRGDATLSADGGSSGSAGGNAGTIEVESGGDLTVQSNSFAAQTLGSNGNGGTVTLEAGLGGSGTLTVDGSLSVDGIGTGNGGNVTLSGPSVTTQNNFNVTSNGGPSNGNGGNIEIQSTGGTLNLGAGSIIANGVGTGAGGTISLVYDSPATLTIGATVSANAPGSGNSGHINITDMANANLTADITGTLSATSVSGINASVVWTVGNSAQNAINVTVEKNGVLAGLQEGVASSITINDKSKSSSDGFSLGVMTATNGDINISDNNNNFTMLVSGTLTAASGNIIINGGIIDVEAALTALNSVQLNAANGLTLGANVTATGGSVTAITGGGSLTVAAGVQISADNGNLILQNQLNGNPNSASGAIAIGNNDNLTALSTSSSQGQIWIAVDNNLPNNPKSGSAPSGLSLNLESGGQAFFGKDGIDAGGSDSATVEGSELVFDTGHFKADAIQLGSDVTILADPPPAAAIPAHIFSGAAYQSTVVENASVATQGVSNAVLPSYAGSLIVPQGMSGVYVIVPPMPAVLDAITHAANAPAYEGGVAVDTRDADESAADQAVSYVESVAPLSTSVETTASLPSAFIKQSSDCHMHAEGGSLILSKGEAVVSTTQPVALAAGRFQVLMEAGTTVEVVRTGLVTIVRNLCDSHRGSIAVQDGMRSVCPLLPGEEVVLGDQSAVRGFVRHDGISRRCVRAIALPGDQLAMHSEVSFVSVADNSRVLSVMLHATNKEDHKVSARLLKAAACLSLITQGHGIYTQSNP